MLTPRHKIRRKRNNFYTKIASYLLNPSSENYNLRNLFWEYLKYFKDENKENKKMAITGTSIEDACENAQNILKLKDILEEKMEEKDTKLPDVFVIVPRLVGYKYGFS